MSGENPESESPPAFQLPPTVVHATQQTVQFHALFQGPLPPAMELAAYEQAHPGAAEWILKQAELNAQHVRDMEKLGGGLQRRDALLFRILPFLVVMIYILSTTAIAIWANAWVGGTLLATGLAGVATAYIKGVMPSGGASDSDAKRPPQNS